MMIPVESTHTVGCFFFCRRRRRKGDIIKSWPSRSSDLISDATSRRRKDWASAQASARITTHHTRGAPYTFWWVPDIQSWLNFFSLSFSLYFFFPQGRKGRSLAPSLDAIGLTRDVFSHYLWNNKRLHLIVIDICAWGWWWCPHQKLMSCDITTIPLVSSSFSFHLFFLFHYVSPGDFSLSAA